MDFSKVVVDPADLEPFCIRRHHAPRHQVVQRGSPQHGFFAACVHRHVAADGRGIGRSRVNSEHQPGGVGCVHHPFGHNPRAAINSRDLEFAAGQMPHFHRAHGFELFGVDDRSAVGERDRAAGVAGAAAARDDSQIQLDQPGHQSGHLGFGIRGQHDKRIFHPPVGGVGDMRDPCQAIKANVVASGDPAQTAQDAGAQLGCVSKPGLEFVHRARCRVEKLSHQFVAPARRTPVP